MFETTNWTEVRSIPAVSATHGVIWSPDSTELIVDSPGPFNSPETPSNVPIVSATNPAADRTVNIINPILDVGAPNTLTLQCRSVLEWSVTGRLALGCGPYSISSYRSVVTASATDGSGVKIVAPLSIGSTSPAVPLRIYGWQGGARFSPSGSRLVLDAFECPGGNLTAQPCTTRLVLATDTENSALTGLTEPLTGLVTLPVGWR